MEIPQHSDTEADSLGGEEFEEVVEQNGDGALKLVIGISAAMVVFLSVAIAALWIISEAADIQIGGPPSALLTWEDEYRDMTGIDSVSGDGTGVMLCVVDSGIDSEHPNLQNIDLAGWHDAIGDSETPYDDEGHGTAMAGIIVAQDGLTEMLLE